MYGLHSVGMSRKAQDVVNNVKGKGMLQYSDVVQCYTRVSMRVAAVRPEELRLLVDGLSRLSIKPDGSSFL